MSAWEISGVPRRLVQDSWWLGADPATGDDKPSLMIKGPIGLVALIAIGDWLFWQQAGPGLSLAIFTMALAVVLRGGFRGRLQISDVLMVLAVVPIIERVQLLSVAFAAVGVVGYGVHHIAGVGFGRVLAALPCMMLQTLPLQSVLTIPYWLEGAVVGARRLLQSGGFVTAIARAVALPVGLGLCFSALLVLANPILADFLSGMFHLNVDPLRVITRVLFWFGLGVAIWPVLAMRDIGPPLTLQVLPSPSHPRFAGIIHAGAVASSLWLFNAMFAVQTGLDAVFLWGSAVLPNGVSPAEYAQRGAYPLVATALLAGAFALVSRPFAAENRMVRGLLLAWVAQNVALVISAIYRLETYVSAYGLTYLRVYAAIWMAMVTAGLMLVVWQVLRGLPNGWLVLRSALLGVGVLYVGCFVNFAGLIADYNLSAWRSGSLAARLDRPYLCQLGPDAWGAMQHHHVAASCALVVEYSYYALDLSPPQIEGWRDWSFRSWRILKGADFANTDRR